MLKREFKNSKKNQLKKKLPNNKKSKKKNKKLKKKKNKKKKKKNKNKNEKKKKNQCEFAKKKTLLLAIETLQNHFIFEFLVFKIFLFGEDSLVKKMGWFLGQVKQGKRQRRYF